MDIEQSQTSLYEAPLAPTRGIITVRNQKGMAHDVTTLRKWIRLNSSVYKTDRIDVCMTEQDAVLWALLANFAENEGVRLSPRLQSACSPDAFSAILEETPHDVCIEHNDFVDTALARWCDTLDERRIPFRIRCGAGAIPAKEGGMETLSALLNRACAITLTACDPFSPARPAANQEESESAVKRLNALARTLAVKGADVMLTGLPFCHIDADNLDRAMNSAQCFLDHGQYHRQSYEFAERMFRFRSCRISTAIENLLARRTSVHNVIDAALFPWIQDYPRLYIRVWMYHKLTRHLWFMKHNPRPLPETLAAYENELAYYRKVMKRAEGPVCSQCRYRMICDRKTEAFSRNFPGLDISAQPGDAVAAAPVQTRTLTRYYDALDAARRKAPARTGELAESTRQLVMRQTPTREISADTYDIVGRYTHHMPGAVRWLSFGKGELESTALARLAPPFTISFTLGGGIATHAGFSFGRHAKLVCPLIDYSHRLTLGVAPDGGYVLLRDGQIVQPTEFEASSHVPPRLAGVLEPRLNLHNIDGMILTQTVMLWEGAQPLRQVSEEVKYSVIIISTRYTRRLQATLMALAHQQGIPRHLFEVIVGYVPGIDATDDLIDSLESSFPDMRLVRFPFSEGRARSKGFMINEALRAVSGKWVLLMDADILLPPDTFSLLEEIEENCYFIAPDGRKMLTPEVTSKLLLNELQPWRDYEKIMRGPGELRKREADTIPIGFFQCIRKEILARIPYHELDHFESSDWLFGRDVSVTYGREYRMRDFYVLHLDHGGSQWYGTHKHR